MGPIVTATRSLNEVEAESLMLSMIYGLRHRRGKVFQAEMTCIRICPKSYYLLRQQNGYACGSAGIYQNCTNAASEHLGFSSAQQHKTAMPSKHLLSPQSHSRFYIHPIPKDILVHADLCTRLSEGKVQGNMEVHKAFGAGSVQ